MPPMTQKTDVNGREYVVVDGRWTRYSRDRELLVGGHSYRVAAGALPEWASTNVRRTKTSRPATGILHVGPRLTTWVYAVLFTAIGVGLPAFWVAYVVQNGWALETVRDVLQGVFLTLLLWGLGILSTLGALNLVTDRAWFDQNTGWAVRWCLFKKLWDVRLDEVLAVQCLHAGWFKGKGGWHDTYQVNLVLKSGERHQVCCECEGERAAGWVRSVANDVAAFLNVPVVDQIPDTWVPRPRLWWD